MVLTLIGSDVKCQAWEEYYKLQRKYKNIPKYTDNKPTKEIKWNYKSIQFIQRKGTSYKKQMVQIENMWQDGILSTIILI